MPDASENLRAAFASEVERALAALAPAGTPMVAAVSGGADSVALAWGLAAQAARWPLLAVAFVDHGLRDVTAERAAANSAALAAKVPFVERRVSLEPGNLQAAARRARYAALVALARELHPDALLATGHTLSDQAETVVARLLRGSGVPGLAGLSPRRGRVVRPLLALSRQETRALGLSFVDDPSNASQRFQRNRLRSLISRLAAEHPGVERTLAALADAARSSTLLLDALAAATPELDLTGADLATAQSWLVHRARVAGARGPDRRAMQAWALALTAGGLDAVSLGEGWRGLAREGRAVMVPDEDPRRTVVAWQPGTYRGPAMEMTITPGLTEPTMPASAGTHSALVRSGVAWPIRLRPARPDEHGVWGDGVDLTTGAPLGGWRVEDASGRTLVPDPARSAEGREAARSEPLGSLDEAVWFRIDLKPFERLRDTRVVGSSKGPLNRE